jgi:hypothetical protein
MPKGHSVLEEEVKALSTLVDEMLVRLCSLELRDKDGRVEAEKRLVVLEKQVAAMNDAYAHGNLPRPQYEQQFKVMPSAFPVSNGT